MSTVALFVHTHRDEALALARRLTDWLDDHGHGVRLPPPDADAAGLADRAVAPEHLATGIDLAIALGGDGTMLRAVDTVADAGVPVMGVHVGTLGYLTEVDPGDACERLEQFCAGDYVVDERMRLAVRVDAPDGAVAVSTTCALNEAVVEKTPMGHTVRLGVAIDGSFFTTYAADGLIVATPTGSTAYSFSARGPIVAPRHRALLLTPVSPHMLFDRTLVLEPGTQVRIEVLDYRAATLSVDGRNLGVLRPGDTVTATAAAVGARLVSFGPRDFHGLLKTKFGLEDR